MYLRNKQALFFTLFFPIVIMFIFGLIGFDSAPTFDVGIAVSNPRSETRQFIDLLKQVEVFKATEGKLVDELKFLRDGDRAVVLEIPDDLITGAVPVTPKEMTVHINESQQPQAQAAISILNQLLDKTTFGLANLPPFFSIKPQVVDSRNLKYLDFLLPGLIAMSVMQMSVFSVAFVFVQYKEKGVLKRLLATPMRAFDFVAANTITRLIVSVIQTCIFIVAGVLILNAQVIGSYPLILLCVILGALMFIGLGFTISGLAKTVDTVPAFANLLIFPMLFLGGVFFSIESMPNWLQKIANVLPLTYFSNSLRAIMTEDAGLGAIKWNIVGMLAWGVALLFIATFTFRFQEKESS